MIPEPYELMLLSLAAFRLFWIIGEDTITEPVRAWLTKNGKREKTELFLGCPWCAGFWISLAAWGAWLALGDWAVWAAVPLAISAAVGTITLVLHAVSDAA
jgi:hypothetical protein